MSVIWENIYGKNIVNRYKFFLAGCARPEPYMPELIGQDISVINQYKWNYFNKEVQSGDMTLYKWHRYYLGGMDFNTWQSCERIIGFDTKTKKIKYLNGSEFCDRIFNEPSKR